MQNMIKKSGFPLPNRRITVNLAPADIRKGDSPYDAREETRCPISMVYNYQHRAVVLAYNLGNFMRRLTLPESGKHWSLRSVTPSDE